MPGYQFRYIKKRFQEANALISEKEASFSFHPTGKELFKKAVIAAINSGLELEGLGKTLPLQGIVDLESQLIHIGALTPRDSEAFIFNEEPLFEHKQSGLFETGRYSPRLFSYQKHYSAGPSAHQQLLLFVTGKDVVSADDAENKRGIAINIQVTNNTVNISIDGNSLSINQTAQYLRTIHSPGHELSEQEAQNKVLKASGIYSQFCEDWLFEKISAACAEVGEEIILLTNNEDVEKNQSEISFAAESRFISIAY